MNCARLGSAAGMWRVSTGLARLPHRLVRTRSRCAAATTSEPAQYEAVLGIETHIQLATHTKAFCSCGNEYGAPPNSHICATCMGHPGTLPILNDQMVRLAVRIGLGLGSTIAPSSKFDRKQYFYCDLPKGYQISQYDEPLCTGGAVELTVPEGKGTRTKTINITRAHIEEDAGKLVHAGADALTGSSSSNVDFNRAGVPLLEIVTEPDLRSGEEVAAYGAELRRIVRFLGASTGNMSEGSLRCDVNISMRPVGREALGTKVEIKNMNSFSAMQKAIEFEISRQTELLQAGRDEDIVQETRLFDENQGKTFSMRAKEGLADYRYFPEPDLPPCQVGPDLLQELEDTQPELPISKRERYLGMKLPRDDALQLADTLETAEYFDAVLESGTDAKKAANWIIGDIQKWCNENKKSLSELQLRPEHLAEMIRLQDDGTISGKICKKILPDVLEGAAAEAGGMQAYVESKGLVQVSDPEAVAAVVQGVLDAFPKQLEEFRGGKTKLQGFFVGEVMKASGGKVNPGVLQSTLKRMLEG